MFRRLSRAVLAVALLSSLALFKTPSASANDWCWNDPIVTIGGHTVQILTGVQGSAADVDKYVERAHVRIFVPKGVDTELLLITDDLYDETSEFARFNGNGKASEFTKGKKTDKEFFTSGKKWKQGDPIPVRVEVTFVASKQMPAAMKVTHSGTTTVTPGHTKGKIVHEFTLK